MVISSSFYTSADLDFYDYNELCEGKEHLSLKIKSAISKHRYVYTHPCLQIGRTSAFTLHKTIVAIILLTLSFLFDSTIITI